MDVCVKQGILPGVEDALENLAEQNRKAEAAKKFEEYVAELSQFFRTEQESWIKQYHVLRAIRDQELYKAEQRSFTAWVKAFSLREHVHESYIWRIFKAGEVLDRYRHGGSDSLAGTRISAEAICLAEKVGRGNDDEAEGRVTSLLDKAISGELQKKDLQRAWRDKKSREQAKEGGERSKVMTSVREEKGKSRVAVASAVLKGSLSGRMWLVNYAREAGKLKERRGDEVLFYNAFQEFAVETAMTRHPRMIDVFIAENWTRSGQTSKITLHGVEIKVSESDLRSDKKMGEYCDFVDFFWVYVPRTKIMLDACEEILPQSYGILAYDRGNCDVIVVRSAQKLEPKARMLALESLTCKLLKTGNT